MTRCSALLNPGTGTQHAVSTGTSKGTQLSLQWLVAGADLVLRQGRLVTDVAGVKWLLAERYDNHTDTPGGLHAIQALHLGLPNINNVGRGNLRELVETHHPTLDDLSCGWRIQQQ